MRWSVSAGWVAITLITFLVFDILDGAAVSAWLLAAVIALLPPLVVMVLSGQEQASSAATALHVVERRPQ
jgi:hypothetical protein